MCSKTANLVDSSGQLAESENQANSQKKLADKWKCSHSSPSWARINEITYKPIVIEQAALSCLETLERKDNKQKQNRGTRLSATDCIQANELQYLHGLAQI